MSIKMTSNASSPIEQRIASSPLCTTTHRQPNLTRMVSRILEEMGSRRVCQSNSVKPPDCQCDGRSNLLSSAMRQSTVFSDACGIPAGALCSVSFSYATRVNCALPAAGEEKDEAGVKSVCPDVLLR